MARHWAQMMVVDLKKHASTTVGGFNIFNPGLPQSSKDLVRRCERIPKHLL